MKMRVINIGGITHHSLSLYVSPSYVHKHMENREKNTWNCAFYVHIKT